LHAINYESPKTVADAVKLLAAHGEKARPLVGGTDLIIQLRAGTRRPEYVVDVKHIPEVSRISFSMQHGLHLGAAVSCIEIHENADMRRYYPGLTEAAHLIGSLQIQSRASVGGNLCNGSPAGDSTPALIALGAKARVVGPQGERTVPVETFITAPGRTVLQPGELLVELLIDAPARHSSDAYLRFIPRNEMDIAVVGVGGSITLDLDDDRVVDARIALGAVGPTPIVATEAAKAIIGKKLDAAALDNAARLATSVATPIDDMRGTAEYRSHIVGVLTRRVLTIAAERARQSEQR
jgi:CO/xanthine dehydrogenase FAD-binding subunit